MLRHHPGQRRRSLLLSGVGVNVNVDVDVDLDGAVVSSPTEASTEALSNEVAASAALHVGYTYPLAAFLNFCPGGYDIPAALSTVLRRTRKRQRPRPLQPHML